MRSDDHTSDTHLDSKIVYHDALPVAFEVVEPGTKLGAADQRNNLELLRAYWILNEKSSEDGKEFPELQAHLERLELKLDMQASLLAMLLARNLELPGLVEISLGSTSVTLHQPGHLEAGELLLLQIYLLPEYPKPLKLIARVQGRAQPGETLLQLLELEPAESELLEKIIFRHHRRQIASLRHKKEP